MFGRRFNRKFREPWPEEAPEHEWEPREHGHAPHHEHEWDPRVRKLREHLGHRPPFGRQGEVGFRFGPRNRPPFDGPFRGGPFGGPFGGDPFDEDGGGRRRQRRGDIKFALLELLAEQPRHGYELIKELEQRYGGFYRPSPGSVYPTLQLLEDEGHLTSATVDGKRVYTITDSGRQLLAERQRSEAERPGHERHGFRGRGGGPELEGLRRSMMALMSGVMESARHGTPEQVQAATKLLDSTRREIYAILSQPESDQAD